MTEYYLLKKKPTTTDVFRKVSDSEKNTLDNFFNNGAKATTVGSNGFIVLNKNNRIITNNGWTVPRGTLSVKLMGQESEENEMFLYVYLGLLMSESKELHFKILQTNCVAKYRSTGEIFCTIGDFLEVDIKWIPK